MIRFFAVLMLAAGPKPAASPSPSPTPTPVPTPSIDASVDFVKEKLVTYGRYTFDVTAADDPKERGKVTGSAAISSFDARECVLTLSKTVEFETSIEDDPDGDFKESSRIELRIPLREMKVSVAQSKIPATYRTDFKTSGADSYAQLELVAKSDRKPIGVTESRSTTSADATGSKDLKDSISKTTIVFADDEIATRSKKALEHAISLCQRKKEAF